MASVAVALSKDLPNGRVMRAIVSDQDLVVWRSKSGILSAWENRCPHRGMRLSHGFVRGEALACMYHGWHYDKSATCRYIPAHPELEPPETIKAQEFSSIEKGGLIWVSVDGSLEEPSVDENLTPLRSINFPCASKTVQEVIAETLKLAGEKDFFSFATEKAGYQHWVLFSEKKGLNLHLFFHELPNNACKIHALLDKDCSAETKKQISRSLEKWRRVAESNNEVSA